MHFSYYLIILWNENGKEEKEEMRKKMKERERKQS